MFPPGIETGSPASQTAILPKQLFRQFHIGSSKHVNINAQTVENSSEMYQFVDTFLTINIQCIDAVPRRVYEYQPYLLCLYMLKVYLSPLHLYQTASEHSRTLHLTVMCSHLYIKFIDTVPKLKLVDLHIPSTYAIPGNFDQVLNSSVITILVAPRLKRQNYKPKGNGRNLLTAFTKF